MLSLTLICCRAKGDVSVHMYNVAHFYFSKWLIQNKTKGRIRAFLSQHLNLNDINATQADKDAYIAANATKMVTSAAPKAKDLNKKIGQIKADLERHFDLIQAKDQIAYPQAVIAAYKTPVNGHDQLQQKKENLEFSVLLNGIIEDYVNLCKKMKKEKERCKVSPERIELFHNQKLSIKEQLKEMEKNSRKLFDNQNRIKTLMLAVDEYLLHFMQLAVVGERSENSLEKWMGRKKRYLEFLNFRFKTSDLPLSKLEFKFLSDLKTFIIVHHNCEENTATKYAQCIKEVVSRAVSNKWISANIFSTFQCSYHETDMNWMSMQDMEHFSAYEFSKPKYNEIRDVYVAMSFLGYAYADIHAAELEDTFIGMDKELWISRNRQKTGEEEALPILPNVRRLIEKYKNHPVCVRKNRLLPVPSNQEFNRCLKEMGKEIGFRLLTEKQKGTHRARYFMVNEVLDNNGVPIKTTGKIAGQKSIRTTEKYIRQNKKHISLNMAMVKDKLFDPDGNLKIEQSENLPEGIPIVNTGLRVVHVKRN